MPWGVGGFTAPQGGDRHRPVVPVSYAGKSQVSRLAVPPRCSGPTAEADHQRPGLGDEGYRSEQFGKTGGRWTARQVIDTLRMSVVSSLGQQPANDQVAHSKGDLEVQGGIEHDAAFFMRGGRHAPNSSHNASCGSHLRLPSAVPCYRGVNRSERRSRRLWPELSDSPPPRGRWVNNVVCKGWPAG